MRGLISNEAGCGTAPFAHAASPTRDPVAQGFFGVIEVFVDTVILCTVTACVILCSGTPTVQGGGMRFALLAYSALLGRAAIPILALSTLLFAFATVVCQSCYGMEALRYFLPGRAARGIYLTLSAGAILIGSVISPGVMWQIGDLVISLMTCLNVVCLLWIGGRKRGGFL